MSTGLEGVDKLLGKFKDLADHGIRKAAKAGVNAGLQPLVSEIRKAVNSAPISPDLKSAVRKTLGKRILKKENQDLTGKAGFGVGKQGGAKGRAAKERAAASGMRGVGVSAADVHWFVLGTQARVSAMHAAPIPNALVMPGLKGKAYRAAKAAAAGAGDQILRITNTGRIEAMLAGFVESAATTAGARMATAMAEKTKQVLAAEAAK
jgi:hypothetical protein